MYMFEKPIQKENFKGSKKRKEIFEKIINSRKKDKEIFNKKDIIQMVLETPNDADLGKKIRNLINSKK